MDAHVDPLLRLSGDSAIDRRTLLRFGAAAAVGTAVAGAATGVLSGCTAATTPRYGALNAANSSGVMLPTGFTATVIGKVGSAVASTGYTLPAWPDGAATFTDSSSANPGGWHLMVNHERLATAGGGVSRLTLNSSGKVISAKRMLGGTDVNCAGGATPWRSWLTGEEKEGGAIWECPVTGTAVRRPRMGLFVHEAAAADATAKVIYMTEDRPDGRLYRFTPTKWGDLSAGALHVAKRSSTGSVTWLAISDPLAATTATRYQQSTSTAFNGGEGICIDDPGRKLWFSTKGDNRIWQFDLAAQKITVYSQGGGSTVMSGVDNLARDRFTGDLLVAEDGGNMEVVLVHPDKTLSPLLRVVGHDGSEITGLAFSPNGKHLHFASQRGSDGTHGVMWRVTGPFANR